MEKKFHAHEGKGVGKHVTITTKLQAIIMDAGNIKQSSSDEKLCEYARRIEETAKDTLALFVDFSREAEGD